MSGLRIGCFACVDSILTIVLVKIYTFYCSMFTFFLLRPYKTIGFDYFSCFSVPVLAVFVVVIACTCLSVCVCFGVSSQHCYWLIGLSCFSIDILWKNLSCPELLFPSFLCLSYVCSCCCVCVFVCLFISECAGVKTIDSS